MQEIQVTRAIILTPSSLVSTKSHHSVTNVRGDMQILAITVGHTDIYYNVGYTSHQRGALTILTLTCCMHSNRGLEYIT